MKKLLFVLAIAALAIGSASAQAFFDDFEGGLGGWNQVYATYPAVWSTDQAHSATHSAKVPGTTANSQATLQKDITNGYTDWFADFWLYDNGPGSTNGQRTFMQFGSYTGATWGSSWQQLICLGVYNSGVDTTKYNARIAFNTNGTAPAWQNLDVARINKAWNHFRVECQMTGTNVGTYTFFVNEAQVGQWTNIGAYKLTAMRIGSAVSNNSVDSFYDDITYGQLAVPEPGSLLALGTGLIGLFGAIRRRK